MAKMGNLKNKIKRDKSVWFLAIPLLIIVGLGLVAFGVRDNVNLPTGENTVAAARPVELSFSDVLRRSDEIKTMNIRGSAATGTL